MDTLRALLAMSSATPEASSPAEGLQRTGSMKDGRLRQQGKEQENVQGVLDIMPNIKQICTQTYTHTDIHTYMNAHVRMY